MNINEYFLVPVANPDRKGSFSCRIIAIMGHDYDAESDQHNARQEMFVYNLWLETSMFSSIARLDVNLLTPLMMLKITSRKPATSSLIECQENEYLIFSPCCEYIFVCLL